jgi:hypothetical protein
MKYFVFCLKFLALTLIIITLFSLTTNYEIQNAVPKVLAQTMSNANYILRFGNFNTAAGKASTGGFTLNITVGQTAPGLYTGTNFKIRAGFQYINSIIPFSFKISQTNIDFGSLSPTIASTRTNTLTVSNGSAFGYAVTASENHPLLVPSSGKNIPDTTCDSGACTNTSPGAWTLPGTYGFGYTCTNLSGTDCISGFSNGTNFAPFAASPSAVAVMSSINVGRNRQSQITYKVNVSNTQTAGIYTNTINFIATPSF